MTKRSVVAVLILALVTFGIYGLVWLVKTKEEMNARGAGIPTAWLLIVPIANLFWMWKYSQGVEKVSSGKMSGAVSFLLLFLLGAIGMAIIQSTFNSLDAQGAMARAA